MTLLFDRYWQVTIGTIQFSSANSSEALRTVFSIKKNLKSQPNTVDLKVYNFNGSHRQQIASTPQITVQIDVGYQQGNGTLFLGDLRSHETVREGANLVTHLGCGDGEKAIQTSRITQTFRKGSSPAQVCAALAGALGVDPGNLPQAQAALAPFAGLFSMGTVLCGSAARELTRILASVGFGWSIQSGKLQILSTKQVLLGSAVLLTPQTGLLDSPTTDKDGNVSCKTLAIPDIFPGRLVIIQSENLKGQYRIQETNTTGDSHGGDWSHEIKGKPF